MGIDAIHELSVDIHERFAVSWTRTSEPFYARPRESEQESRATLCRLPVRAADKTRGVCICPDALVMEKWGRRVVACRTLRNEVGCEWCRAGCPWGSVSVPRGHDGGVLGRRLLYIILQGIIGEAVG